MHRTKEQIKKLDKMRRFYEKGWTLQKIGDHFGISRQRVHQVLIAVGVEMRPPHATKRSINRETLVRRYIDRKLTLGEIAKSLKTTYPIISRELDRHGIEKRPVNFFKRKHPELYQLKIGEKKKMPRPSVTQPYRNMYEKARRIGIRISIQSIDENTFQILRLE